MDGNLDYEIGMREKKKLYQQAGKKLLSLHGRDLPRLREALRQKLSQHLRVPGATPESAGRTAPRAVPGDSGRNLATVQASGGP
jgi:hypothetical protein